MGDIEFKVVKLRKRKLKLEIDVIELLMDIVVLFKKLYFFLISGDKLIVRLFYYLIFWYFKVDMVK